MAKKPITQWILEAIAVAAVIAVGVLVTLSIGNRFRPKPPIVTRLPDPPTRTPQTDFTPNRPAVMSVAKLPAHYPELEQVALAAATPPPRAELPAYEAEALAQIRVRHWSTFSRSAFYFLPGHDLAVVEERTPASTYRLAIWDLQRGKIVRFLSAEPGQGTQPYRGAENTNFGVPVDFQTFHDYAVSPSGKRFAARRSLQESGGTTEISVWEIATGKLLLRYQDQDGFDSLFLFPSDDYVVVNASFGLQESALLRIAVNSGHAELLGAIQSGSPIRVGTVASEGQLLLGTHNVLQRIDVGTRRREVGESLSGQNPQGYWALWITPDGAQAIGFMYGLSRLDTWDLATLRRVGTEKLNLASGIGSNRVLVAAAAGRIALEGLNRDVEFYDSTSGELETILRLPFTHGSLKAITPDGRRLAIGTDQSSTLIVDLPEGLSRGMLSLSDLLGKKLAATHLAGFHGSEIRVEFSAARRR